MKKYTEPDAQVYLRELTPEDITDEYLCWFADDDVNKFLDVKSLTYEEARDFLVSGKRLGTHFMYAVVDLVSDKHIGNVKVGPLDSNRLTTDVVTVIGDTSYKGRGIGTEALRIGQTIAFDVYDVRKLVGGIYEPNIASRKAYGRCGWIEVGRIKDAAEADGVMVDEIVIENYNPKYYFRDSAGIRPRP